MATKKVETKPEGKSVAIAAPNFARAEFKIIGNAPYVQNKFSAKAKQMMQDKMEAGSQAKKGTKRDPKDFDACYQAATYKSKQGWHGIPASAFRKAAISACRIVGFKMTIAKLSLFVEADGFDAEDGTPLIKITKGKPARRDDLVRNATGVVDIRARPGWEPGWEAMVRVRYDADQFSLVDVTNLMMRVGFQVGIGEGRPDSKNSAGMEWGTFELAGA